MAADKKVAEALDRQLNGRGGRGHARWPTGHAADDDRGGIGPSTQVSSIIH